MSGANIFLGAVVAAIVALIIFYFATALACSLEDLGILDLPFSIGRTCHGL